MGRGPKPTKSKAKPAVPRKSRKEEDSKLRELERRLAAAQEQLHTRDHELVEARERLTAASAQVSESHEQQTATSEILRVISQSPTHLQPVFDAIVRNAVQLCGAIYGSVFRSDGALIHIVAQHNFTSDQAAHWQRMFPLPVGAKAVISRTIRSGTVLRIADVETEDDPDFMPEGRVGMRARGVRSLLQVPMFRGTAAVGAISLSHALPKAFTDAHVELLQTFADQAVIAIENVRLFTELQASNRDLTRALDRETATSEILRVISRSPTDVQPVFDAIVDSAVRLLGAYSGSLNRLVNDQITLVALTSTDDEGDAVLRSFYPAPVQTARGMIGQVIRDRGSVNISDAHIDPRLSEAAQTVARARGYRSQLGVPLLRRDEAIGALAVTRREPGGFTHDEIALLQIFADQAVIAIENVRLFTELQEKNRALTAAHAQVSEALERQTATSEILRVISSSPTEIRPVFDTIAGNARRLCNADSGAVFTYDGRVISLQALDNTSPEGAAALRRAYPREATLGTAPGRAILTAQPVHLPDLLGDPTYEIPVLVGAGIRSVLAVPMLRGAAAVGAIVVHTWEISRPFTEAQVDLLRAFADQAVIAIENVRLFQELEVANRELAAASRHKSEFLANMSHELRTPLNAIIGFSEVLSDKMFGDLTEKQEEYSQDIHASGQHLLSLINDILDLSKIEAGRMELELTEFDLPTAIDNALMLVRERAGRRSIALHTEIDGRLGQVLADERKVRQIVLNLLSNAIKFTPEGGRIDVGAVSKDGFAEVSVTDTGVGIAPGDQEAVFEEFRQVGTAAKKVEGTGLGLTLCRKFVELHGGRIWVKSQVSEGSTFTFTIPLRQGD